MEDRMAEERQMPEDDAEATASTVRTGAGELAYRRDGWGKPLLLLQRFRGTIDDWDPAFVDALVMGGREVVRSDNAGIGRSGGTTSAPVVEWAEVALSFADAIGLDRFDLLGWSMGGMVAQWVALKAPKRISRLVLASTSPGNVIEKGIDNPEVMEIRNKPVPTKDDVVFLFFSHDERGQAVGRAVLERTAAHNHGPAVSNASFKAQLEAARNFNTGPDAARSRLGELAMPILVANGNADIMQPPLGSFVIATEAQDAKLVLYPKGGHAFLFQQLDEFTAEVSRFLDGPPASGLSHAK